MSRDYKPLKIEWTKQYPERTTLKVLSNLAIAESNLIRAGKDSALPHFIAIVKEIERILGFKFSYFEEEDKKEFSEEDALEFKGKEVNDNNPKTKKYSYVRTHQDALEDRGIFIPIPSGEPFEEALRSFLEYANHQRIGSQELSRLISEFCIKRSEMGKSSFPTIKHYEEDDHGSSEG